MLCQQLPFDDEELEDTGERLLAIRRSQEPLDEVVGVLYGLKHIDTASMCQKLWVKLKNIFIFTHFYDLF